MKIAALLLTMSVASGLAFAQEPQPPQQAPALPPPSPPAAAPPPPPAIAGPTAMPVPAMAAPAAPTVAPAPVYKAMAPSTVVRSSRPAMSAGAISRSMSREVHALLYRLDQRMQQFSRDYNRPPAMRPNVQQLDGQLDEIENLLSQLNRHSLPTERQATLFKTEMNLRKLRETTVPDL